MRGGAEVRANGKLRKDSQQFRERLVDGAGELLAERGTRFSLPDLARHTGVSTATVYRHFENIGEVHQAFAERTLTELIDRLALAVSSASGSREMLSRACRTWVALGAGWGKAATYMRRPEGVLERYHANDESIGRLFGVLRGVLDALAAEGEIPEQDHDYALLLWVTLFDERVFIDLLDSTNWSVSQIASVLESSLIGALRNRPQ